MPFWNLCDSYSQGALARVAVAWSSEQRTSTEHDPREPSEESRRVSMAEEGGGLATLEVLAAPPGQGPIPAKTNRTTATSKEAAKKEQADEAGQAALPQTKSRLFQE